MFNKYRFETLFTISEKSRPLLTSQKKLNSRLGTATSMLLFILLRRRESKLTLELHSITDIVVLG